MEERIHQLKQVILKNRILYNFFRKIQDEYTTIQLNLLIKKYIKNPDKIKSKLTKRGKYVVIEKGKYNYNTFSAFYLNNMVSLILKSLMKGNIPIVKYKTNLKTKKSNNWSDFFKQPIVEEMKNIKMLKTETSVNCRYKPSFSTIYSKRKLKIWGNIYNEFIKFNSEFDEYFQKEYDMLIKGKSVLGIICRGTDYIRTKPKYHPIQPDIDDVINEAKNLLKEKKYEYIYLATEEEKYYKKFVETFGRDKIITNQRKYYDSAYDKMDQESLLYSISFDREDDQYQKGKEYLSSMKLLSCCDALIGGHCGGSDLALYFNNCKYDYVHIYNLGVY